MDPDSKGIIQFCNIVSDTTCSAQYQNIIGQITNTMVPYDGVALPSNNDLYCIQCPILIDPIKLSVKLLDSFYKENLGNSNIKMVILVSNKSDYSKVVNLLESLKVSNQTKIIVIGKKNKVDISEYDVVIIASHLNSNNDAKSIESLSKINWSNPKQSMFLAYKFRKDYNKSYIDALLKETCKKNIIIYNNELGLPDKIKKLNIDFRYLISNLNNDAKSFMDILNRIFTDYDLRFKKMICITETEEMAKLLKKQYTKLINKNTYDNPHFLNMKLYTNDDLDTFMDLNNNFVETVILNRDINKNIASSGILFITEKDLLKNINNSIALRYTDTLILFNKSGTNTNIINLVNVIITSNSFSKSDIPIPFLVVEFNHGSLGKQLYDVYETFYHTDISKEQLEINNLIDNNSEEAKTLEKTLEKTFKIQSYADLNNLLDSKIINSDINITAKRKAKLESIYSIKTKDYNYIDRYSITYINDITNNSNKISSGYLYDLEYEYLYIHTKTGKLENLTGFMDNENYLIEVDNRTEQLKTEVDKIVNAENNKTRLKKYSGPMWLGKLNGNESEGSLIAFADANNDTIEFSKILGTYYFNRTYKRKGWTEKDNRDRKILFLSPVFKKDLLSNFKKDNKKIKRMQKVYFDYD